MNNLIQLSRTRFIIVNDSKIKENDSFYVGKGFISTADSIEYDGNKPIQIEDFTHDRVFPADKCRKITHSTCNINNTKHLSLEQVYELLGLPNIEKAAEEYSNKQESHFDNATLYKGFLAGYFQAIHVNREKLYSNTHLNYILDLLSYDDMDEDIKIQEVIKFIHEISTPKNEWAIELKKNNKYGLKLKK